MRRHLLVISGLSLAALSACEKPQQDTSNPVYTTEEDARSKEIPDYSKSACAGQKSKVKTPGGEVAVTCKAEGQQFRLYLDDGYAAKTGDIQAAAAGLDRIADTLAFDPMMGTVGNVFAVLGAPATEQLDGGKLSLFAVTQLGGDASTAVNTPANGAKTLEAVQRLDAEQTIDATFNAALSAKAMAHAITSAGDPDEEPWIVESLGWAGSIASGLYGNEALVDDFLAKPNRAWGPGAEKPDPGAALLFGAFLYERFGAEFTKALVKEQANGWEGLEAVSKAKGKGDDRFELFKQWSLTVWFTDPGTGYGFKFSGLSQPEATIVKDEPRFEGTVQAWGLSYYLLPPAQVPVTFTTDGDAFAFVGMRNDEGVVRQEVVRGEPLRLDLTNADRAVVVVSAPKTSTYVLALDEPTAVKAEKGLAKAKQNADKEAAKKAKQAEKDDAKKAKQAEKDAKKAEKDAAKPEKDAKKPEKDAKKPEKDAAKPEKAAEKKEKDAGSSSDGE